MPAVVRPHTPSPAVTAMLAEWALSRETARMPADVCEAARRCVLDWMAVALAGASDPLIRILIDAAMEEGGHPHCTLIAQRERVAPLQAALINGTTSHVLDYDDVNLSMNGHPTAAVLPAVLALAEKRGASGTEILAAFVAGYETAARVGLLVAPGHYARGYHATCTIGVIAAAAGCARLLRLNADAAARAIGIAATQASGLKGQFGTQCKPFHAGVAAQNGLRAALLASRGMESRPDALECRGGFAATLSPDFEPGVALADPQRYFIRDNLFKYHAACYGTHSAIECVRQLRADHGLPSETIRRVVVRAANGADSMCNIQKPRTSLEAKFSLRFTTAAALLGRDTSDLSTYSGASCADLALIALRDKITVELVGTWPQHAVNGEVIIETIDGKRLQAAYDAGVPDTDRRAQGERLDAKFDKLAGSVLGTARASALKDVLNRLE
ncbi:MAG: MmgE/PrpD family protein, partial [Burkholderiales bacterium]